MTPMGPSGPGRATGYAAGVLNAGRGPASGGFKNFKLARKSGRRPRRRRPGFTESRSSGWPGPRAGAAVPAQSDLESDSEDKEITDINNYLSRKLALRQLRG